MANALVEMQKLANKTQVELQKMVNSANTLQSQYNAEEAQKSRDWQTEMSKTSHQMEVEDLKKAGLNPVLSSGGSGAQSYTTSSASIQPESGASALSNVQSSQLSAIGNMESSRIQAAAQRAAAAQSAAAMRYAAAQSAAAAIYQANKSAEAQKYNADINRKNVITRAKADKWISQNKQASSVFGLADKYLTKTGVGNLVAKQIKSNIKSFTSKANKIKNFANTGAIKAGNFVLSNNGVALANRYLSKLGISQTKTNRRQLYKACVYGNSSSMAYITRLATANRRGHVVKHKR